MIKVACAIIVKNNKILVAQRKENMTLPLKWEFPGGKIEEGEREEDCLIREIREELGIEVKIIQDLPYHIHQYNSNLVVKLIPFVCHIVDGKIELREHQQVLWLNRNQLPDLDWAEADIPVMDNYIKNY